MRKALSPRVRGSRPPRHVQHSQLEWPSLKDRSGAGGGRAPPALLVPTARPSTSRLLNPRRKLASRQPEDVRTPEHLVPREGVGAAAGCQPRCDARVPPFLPSLGKKQPSGPWGHWLETEKVRYAWEPPGGHSGAGGPPCTAPSPGRVPPPHVPPRPGRRVYLVDAPRAGRASWPYRGRGPQAPPQSRSHRTHLRATPPSAAVTVCKLGGREEEMEKEGKRERKTLKRMFKTWL